ncbi:MAG: translation initiation factor IF-2 [Rhodospirillales bacterium RIFCSPLOWO2_12_FULL_58_28]|nr:MAG: translation initiation factor IF-2 [Rhodospirillales bacterium RIFCSPLOWO2_02_FULL_58_16]OHC77869.1 MAG: translation initiation factor IF-2 [Rhodospirillales bacterium RIFCSPLOWO2_12_FULL_58_28]
MTEIKEKEQDSTKKPGTIRPGRMELNKTIESGQVRQNFSHGRSKMVTVEVRKKRTFATDAGGRMAEVKRSGLAAHEAAFNDAVRGIHEDDPVADSLRLSGQNLTTEEKAVRVRALEDARKADDMAAKRADEAPSEAPGKEAEKGVADKDDVSRLRTEKEDERRREDEDTQKREQMAKASAAAALVKLQAMEESETNDDKKSRDTIKRAARTETLRPVSALRRGEPRRRSGKLTIDEALGVREERTRSLASVKRARAKQKQQFNQGDGNKIFREVTVPETITVQELSNRMAERGADVIRALMKMDVMVTLNQVIDADTAELVVAEFGHKLKRVSESDVEIGLKGEVDEAVNLISRAPVVTVMGHVDHGKTSLLDALREANVADREAGGITQHIGAYQVTCPSGGKITFIDTPGHAAFTAMRARGAKVTDIVVLVVAADDGIMPQTIEAISHAKAANVPIVVAINKMDKPNADAGRVRTELLQHDVVVEEMGGDVLAVEVSAKGRTNLDKLEEVILLQAEVLDLKSNPNRPAEGVVIESKVERGRGPVATVLVKRGTLRLGDIIVAGGEWGRVRALIDSNGKSLEEAGPSVPVEVLGLSYTPFAGDEVAVIESEARAREVTEFRKRKLRDAKAAKNVRGTLAEMFETIADGEAKELPVVVKTDVHGSEEAILAAMNKMGTNEVKVTVLYSGVGGVNESDVILARASNALVIGFNVRANPQARAMAKRDAVEIRYYSIIYNVIDDLRGLLSGMLSPTIKEKFLGNAEIREVFNITKVGKVAGCMVVEGIMRRGAKVRLVRDSVVIHEGDLSQLKRFKDDVKEVKDGQDCGMAFANYHDIQAGDVIECFEIEEVARELEA